MNSSFAHLHLHTHYSLLESSIRLKSLFGFLAEDKAEAVAITDHGNLFGAVEFFVGAKEHGLKPIIGCELYVTPGPRTMRGANMSGDEEIAPYAMPRSGLQHLVLLAQNEIGYQNLCALISIGYLEGFYYRPRVDKEALQEYNEGLIALSACLKGEVPALCWMGDMDRAREATLWYQNIFKDRYYLEVNRNGLPQQMAINQRLMELARDLKIPLVATADSHYLRQEDAAPHEALMSIQTGRKMEETAVRSDEFYVKSQRKMLEDFTDLPEALASTLEIAERCEFEFQFTTLSGKKIYHFPKFDPPEGKTAEQHLRDLSHANLERRYTEISENLEQELTAELKAQYVQRLDRELDVIIQMGFTGYFLIVADFIHYAKTHQIPVGPGRGSGAGSLVAYCLRITELDPLEHGLLFERFLNPERVSLPDFDIDFCMEKRDQIIRYVSQKYGKDSVAQIITFGKLQARGVIRDVGRVLGLAAQDVDKIAKLVPETLNITLEEAFAQEPRLPELAEKDPQVRRLFSICRQLEGLYRHASIHAAGLVISNRPMVEHCPLYRGKNDELVIQYDMNNADRIGLIKFDFLGLKTLTFLEKTEKLVNRRHSGANLNILRIPLKDPKMYELLSRGDTSGIFQMESSGMQDLMRRVRPDKFADIIAINALYRPGPIGSGMLDDYIGRKHGEIPIEYDFPELSPILNETYGVIVYQEQVQQVAMRLASYTAGGADLLRRAMGKKKPEEMAKQKAIFVEGATKNGFDKGKIEKLFDLMEKFAGYGFNKSHAAAYSLVTCQTAYLKTHYPVEFYACLLSIERENTDKIARYIMDAQKHGISILRPDINESDTDFTVLSEKEIRFGLGAIKGVGQIAIDSVLEARNQDGPFEDLFDLCARANTRTVNRRVIEAFIRAGALDGFGIHRAKLFCNIDQALEQGSQIQKEKDENQASFLDLGICDSYKSRKVTYREEEPWPRNQELKWEKDTIGFYVTGHPLEGLRPILARFTSGTIASLLQSRSGKECVIGGILRSFREIFTKRGDRMAFLALEDLTEQIEAVVFSDIYLEYEELIKQDIPLWIRGTLEVGENGPKLILSKKSNSKIVPLEFAFEEQAKELHLHLRVDHGEPLTAQVLHQARDYFASIANPQGVPVFLHVGMDGTNGKTVLELGQRVPPRREFIEPIRQVFRRGVELEFT